MRDEKRKSQQLDVAKRLRVMQTQKARLQQVNAQHQVHEAQKHLLHQQDGYQGLLAMYANQKSPGCSVDPFLYEQRLIIQAVAYEQLKGTQSRLDAAECHRKASLKRLVEATTQENLAIRAYEQSMLRLQLEHASLQAIDVSDAQLGSYARHGL